MDAPYNVSFGALKSFWQKFELIEKPGYDILLLKPLKRDCEMETDWKCLTMYELIDIVVDFELVVVFVVRRRSIKVRLVHREVDVATVVCAGDKTFASFHHDITDEKKTRA